MKESNASVKFKRLVHPPKYATTNSPGILRTYANTTLHTEMTQKTTEIIDPNDTVISTDIIRIISETAQDRLIASIDTSHGVQIDSETTHAIVLTAHSHQVASVSKIDINVAAINIHRLINLHETCHVLYVVVQNIHLKAANILLHRNTSRQT